MTRDGRTKTATSNGLVRRRRSPRARRPATARATPTTVGAGPDVAAIVLLPSELRLLDRLAGLQGLLVRVLELVRLLLRGQLAGQHVLEALAHLRVEPGGRQHVDVVAERPRRP